MVESTGEQSVSIDGIEYKLEDLSDGKGSLANIQFVDLSATAI